MLKIKSYFLSAIILFSPGFFLFGTSDSIQHDSALQTLDIIKNSFQVQYAPKEWKKNYYGWDLDSEIEKAKDLVSNSDCMTVKDFQRIVRDFFKSMQDYHVSVNFYSTEVSILPFRVKGADNHYFITYIDRERLSSSVFPFEVGDELLMFDDRQTKDVVKELRENEVGNANDETDYAMAEVILTSRIGSMGHIVPKGPVMITVKSAKNDSIKTYQLIWQHFPEKIATPNMNQKAPKGFNKGAALRELLGKELTTPLYTHLVNARRLDATNNEDRDQLGSRKGFIPVLGKVWWQSDESTSFNAYLYETPERDLIGYIRIPNYFAGEQEASEFAKIIDFMQERSDALIIDQVNNPGGSVFYLYALLSMLTDQPLSAPRHRMSITQKEVMNAATFIPVFEMIETDTDAQNALGETLDGNPVTHQMAQFFLNYFRFIVDEWGQGRTLTKPFYLYGIDHINPHPTSRYTKPILVLMNSLDFSGGDFFPAILQDNNRIVTMGSRTAGAGGFVTGASFPNLFGIANYSYTASIAERADSNPIENLGVEPDIHYKITIEDLQHNYRDFVKSINQTVKSLVSTRKKSNNTRRHR